MLNSEIWTSGRTDYDREVHGGPYERERGPKNLMSQNVSWLDLRFFNSNDAVPWRRLCLYFSECRKRKKPQKTQGKNARWVWQWRGTPAKIAERRVERRVNREERSLQAYKDEALKKLAQKKTGAGSSGSSLISEPTNKKPSAIVSPSKRKLSVDDPEIG